MRIIIIILLCFCSYTILAQTKKIAFKSHSGNIGSFHLALGLEEADMENSNFGMAPEPMVKSAQLDSVIFLCDTIAIMVTSKYCRYEWQPEKEARKWRGGGKDTVFHHPLFSNQLSLDSIRSILKNQYFFRNPVEEVVFVGFEEPIAMNRERNQFVLAAVKNNDNQDPFNGQFTLITALIFGLALLGGWISWKIGNRLLTIVKAS